MIIASFLEPQLRLHTYMQQLELPAAAAIIAFSSLSVLSAICCLFIFSLVISESQLLFSATDIEISSESFLL